MSSAKRAAFAGARFSKAQPWPTYGATRVLRGTPGNLARFGVSARSASAAQKAARRATGYTGKGAYFGRTFGSMAGSALGGWMGGPRGAAIGAQLGGAGLSGLENMALDHYSSRVPAEMQRTARAYRGSGLYQGFAGSGMYDAINSNNLVTGATASHLSNSMPHMSGSVDETGAVRVCHREYLSDVYAPGVAGSGVATAFQNAQYALNPALQGTFVFLSQIAQNYDEYEFKKLIFHYRSTTTDIGNSTTGQCGTVILATNYNSSAPPFTDKQSMLEYAHAHDCKVTESMTHGVECDPKKTSLSSKLFTRSNPVVTGQDLKTYDHGLFQIALANLPSAYNGLPVGELWVEYDVVLRKPKLFVSRGLEIDQDSFTTVSGGGTVTNPLGLVAGSILNAQQNNIGCAVTATAGVVTVTIPAAYTGALEFTLYFATSAAAGLTFTPVVAFAVVSGNIAQLNDIYSAEGDPTSTFLSPGGGQAYLGGSLIYYALVAHVFVKASTSGVNNTVSFTITGGSASAGQGMLNIRQYQSQGLTSTAGRTVWINPALQVVTP